MQSRNPKHSCLIQNIIIVLIAGRSWKSISSVRGQDSTFFHGMWRADTVLHHYAKLTIGARATKIISLILPEKEK